MNETSRHDDESVAHLLRRAIPAPELSDDEVDAVRLAAKQAWRETLAARESSRRRGADRRRKPSRVWPRRMAWAGLMAALVLVAIMLWRASPESGTLTTPVMVARVESAQGQVDVETGVELGEGTRIGTGSDGHVALRTLPGGAGPGVQIRLDVDSAVRLASDRRVELERGAVYVDTGRSGAENPEAAIEILTTLGLIQDIGTRFEVRWLPVETAFDKALRLRVRDGEVVFEPGEGTSLRTREVASAGTEIELSADGQVQRGVVPLRGPVWDWVHRAAPPFDLEGKSLDEFFNWLRLEANLTIRFADPSLVEESGSVILHGSIEGMAPTEALSLVLLSSGLHADLTELESGGEIVIEADAVPSSSH